MTNNKKELAIMDETPYQTIIEDSGNWSVAEFLSFRRQARRWLIPTLIACVAVVGSWFAVDVIEQTFQTTLEKKISAIVAATANSVTLWSEQQTLNAQIIAKDARTERLVGRVLERQDDEGDVAEIQAELNERLSSEVEQFGFSSFAVFDASGGRIAQSDSNLANPDFDSMDSSFLAVFCGETVFAEPNRDLNSPACSSPLRVAAPIQNRRGDILATLVCVIPTNKQFQRTMRVSRFGETGRNYAVDRQGVVVEGGHQIKTDPLVQRLLERANKQSQDIAIDADGFLDHAGRQVVGGARWLPKYGMGIVSTIDYDEAYASHNLFKRINSFVTGLALLGASFGLIYTWYLSRAQLRAMRAERRLKQLGRYSLNEKIGEGGMGEVYRATHSMLRRPTAVKLLRVEKSSSQSIERFEREVQLTAQLTHPNTISIYDYGRTSDGVFYYAMEYLDGMDLKKLVEREGPQPEARVIHILRQICGSLEEAHDRGLVHRDIKPANVILCQRGGQHDVAKLLDFGLVYNATSLRDTMQAGITGTPAFMSPESITQPTQVDHRSDIYSFGALAYFLLTGAHTFSGSSVAEIWDQQLHLDPVAPSSRVSRSISGWLEELTIRCLAIAPSSRPQSVGEIRLMLDAMDVAWSQEEAKARWSSENACAENVVAVSPQIDETIEYAVS